MAKAQTPTGKVNAFWEGPATDGTVLRAYLIPALELFAFRAHREWKLGPDELEWRTAYREARLEQAARYGRRAPPLTRASGATWVEVGRVPLSDMRVCALWGMPVGVTARHRLPVTAVQELVVLFDRWLEQRGAA